MIKTLTLINFRRYRNCTLNFGKGINVVVGENNAGKTSLFYAIEYCLFGRVGRFKSPSFLFHPKQRQAGVELILQAADKKRFRLQRMHEKPARSRVKVNGHFTFKQIHADGDESYLLSSDFNDHEEKLAVKLNEIFGISRRLFEMAIHIRQGTLGQILEGNARLDMILGVTASVVAGEEIRSMALEFEKSYSSLPVLKETLINREADLTSLRSHVKKLDDECQTTSGEIEKLIQNITALSGDDSLMAIGGELEKLENLSSKLSNLENEKKRHQETEEKLRTDTELKALEAASTAKSLEIDEQLNTLTMAVDASRETLREIDLAKGDLRGRIDRRKSLSDKAGAVCEYCGQMIDIERNKKEIISWEDEIADLENKFKTIHDKLTATSTEIRQCQENKVANTIERKEIKKELEEIGRLKEFTSEIENRLRNEQVRFDTLRCSLNLPDDICPPENHSEIPACREEVRRRIHKSQVQEARLDSELKHKQQRWDQLNADRDNERKTIRQVEKEAVATGDEVQRLESKEKQACQLRVLVSIFKELQVKLREKAAGTLAARTHEIHQKLSINENELLSVGIDPKNYEVQVTAFDCDASVPAWLYQGGGHKQLLGLAFRMALSEIVENCPFLLLDEPTDGLDQQHRKQLMDKLGELMPGKQILVITHEIIHQHSGHLHVVRDGGLSSVEQVK